MSQLALPESLTVSYKACYSAGGMDIRMRFRVRVADLLEQRGLKQKALRADNSEGWISNIMTGRRGIRLEDLETIAGILNTPPAELIRDPANAILELTPLEVRLVEAFRVLSGHEQAALLTIATLRQRKARQAGRPNGSD